MKPSDEFFKPQMDFMTATPYQFRQWVAVETEANPHLSERQVTKWLESHECTVERPFFLLEDRDDILTLMPETQCPESVV